MSCALSYRHIKTSASRAWSRRGCCHAFRAQPKRPPPRLWNLPSFLLSLQSLSSPQLCLQSLAQEGPLLYLIFESGSQRPAPSDLPTGEEPRSLRFRPSVQRGHSRLPTQRRLFHPHPNAPAQKGLPGTLVLAQKGPLHLVCLQVSGLCPPHPRYPGFAQFTPGVLASLAHLLMTCSLPPHLLVSCWCLPCLLLPWWPPCSLLACSQWSSPTAHCPTPRSPPDWIGVIQRMCFLEDL